VLRLDEGRDLAYADYGNPEGPVVFAFHGTPGSHGQMSPFDAAGLEHGIRIIAPDRPGYGHSTYNPDRALLDWPHDVVAITDELGIGRFGVIGVSGGGPHAAVCAHGLADRLTGCAIVSGIGTTYTSQDAEGMMPFNQVLAWMARRVPFLLIVPFVVMSFLARLLPKEKLVAQLKSQMPPADVEILERPGVGDVLLDGVSEKHPTVARASAQDLALFAKSWGFAIEDIAVNVDVWHGDADVNVPVSHGRRYADLIPGATLHFKPGEGHLLVMDYEAEILRAAIGRPVDA